MMTVPSPKSPRPRGRPSLSDEEMADMRRHISDCALRLFHTYGYDAVSMRRLAKEAGCTVMTIYRYFERKIDILRALWAGVFNILFDQLDASAEAEADARKRLNRIAFEYVDFWLNNREHYFLVFMSSGISQSDVSVFVEDDEIVDRFDIFGASIGNVVGPDAGEAEIGLKTQLLLCALNGISHNLITISGYNWVDPEDLVRAAVDGTLSLSA